MYSLPADNYPNSHSLLSSNNNTSNYSTAHKSASPTPVITGDNSNATNSNNNNNEDYGTPESQVSESTNSISFINPLDTVNKINYPIQNISSNLANSIPFDQRQLIPSKATISKRKYSTSIDERNFLTVYEFMINGSWIIWDYYTGLVHLTGLWKSIGNSKADIVKLLDSSPELESKVKRVRGGFLRIQGTWVPFEIGRQLATRFCYSIRYALVPIFGPDFVDSCLKPNEKGFGMLRLNINESDFNENNKKKRRRRSKKMIMEQRLLLEEKKRLKQVETMRLEMERQRERNKEFEAERERDLERDLERERIQQDNNEIFYNSHQMYPNNNTPSSYFIAPKQETPLFTSNQALFSSKSTLDSSLPVMSSSNSKYRLPVPSISLSENSNILSTPYFSNVNRIITQQPSTTQQQQQKNYYPSYESSLLSSYPTKATFKTSSSQSISSNDSDEEYDTTNQITHRRFRSYSSETKPSTPHLSHQYLKISAINGSPSSTKSPSSSMVNQETLSDDEKSMIEAANSLINVKHRLSMSYSSPSSSGNNFIKPSTQADESSEMKHSESTSSNSSSTSLYNGSSLSPLNTTAITASPSNNSNASYTYKMSTFQSPSSIANPSMDPNTPSQSANYTLPSTSLAASSSSVLLPGSNVLESRGLLMDLQSSPSGSSSATNKSNESNIRYHLTHPAETSNVVASPAARKMTIEGMLL